jgi:hypothetical protein
VKVLQDRGRANPAGPILDLEDGSVVPLVLEVNLNSETFAHTSHLSGFIYGLLPGLYTTVMDSLGVSYQSIATSRAPCQRA